MKYTDVGGQAVIEGVMMKSKDRIALSVRDANNKIQFKAKPYSSPAKKHKFFGWPIVRGCVNFFDMLVLGIKTLNDSARIAFDEEEEPMSDFAEKALIVGSAIFAIALSVGMFFILPTVIAGFFRGAIENMLLINLLEGFIRLVIFIGYLFALSFFKDIKRLFMYHGAEHKTIACYEHNLELNVENVKKQSRFHPRCGTTFLFLVMMISILVYSCLIWTDNVFWRVFFRLLLLPFVAGVSYEALKGLAKTENKCSTFLKAPGLALQKITTSEPDDSMIEVAIVAFKGAICDENEMDSWKQSDAGIDFSIYEDL